MTKTDLKKITECAEEFFEKMQVAVSIETKLLQDNTVAINLDMESPQIFIGESGQTLATMQYLLKAILRRKTKEFFYINLDINDYKKKKSEYLKEMVVSVADEVVLLKKEELLPAMSAYERRIVHLELAKRQDVITESVGEEPERRILIKSYLKY